MMEDRLVDRHPQASAHKKGGPQRGRLQLYYQA